MFCVVLLYAHQVCASVPRVNPMPDSRDVRLTVFLALRLKSERCTQMRTWAIRRAPGSHEEAENSNGFQQKKRAEPQDTNLALGRGSSACGLWLLEESGC